MKTIMLLLGEFEFLTVVIRLIIAALIGGFIGSERGRHGRPAGLRTHILICIGAAMTSITSMYLSEVLGYTSDVARLSAQVISGIGFLGAGTIMVRNSSIITGLTTAAGMWATATIGISIGYGFYTAAIAATLICIFSVTVLSRLERKRKNTINVYIEFTDITETERIVDMLLSFDKAVSSYDIIPPKSGHPNNVGITFVMHGKKNYEELEKLKLANNSVVMIIKDVNT